MTLTPYQLAQMAVDIVGTSPHMTNKIAAAIQGKDGNGNDFHLAGTNSYPPAIQEKFGVEQKIGNASPTVHAEITAIQKAPRTEGAAMAITDPFCPNCAKDMAEAGIKSIYIDHKGFDKDWAKRNGKDFDHMSMRIAQHAGISVYVVNRKEEKLVPIFESSSGYTPTIENPIYMSRILLPLNIKSFLEHIGEREKFYKDRPFAAAFAQREPDNFYVISADEHPSIGYTSETIDEPEGKYSFTLQPLNRLMMAAKRSGLNILSDFLFVSRTPTARELVNAIGANFTKLHIGDLEQSRGPNSLVALKILKDSGLIEISEITHQVASAAEPR